VEAAGHQVAGARRQGQRRRGRAHRDIGGFFEKTFAPLGLRKIQGEVLDNLKKQVERSGSA
jgi:hypothetical protein